MSAQGEARLFGDAAAVVWLSGPERLAFLERMSTARLADLAAGAGRAGAVLTDAGRVVDLVACHAGPEGAVLVTSGRGSPLAAHLRRYVMYRDQVRVTDAEPQVAVWRLLGPGAAAVAGRATGLDGAGLAPGDWRVGRLGGEALWLLRHPAPGGLGGLDLVLPRGPAEAELIAALTAAGARPGQPAEYASARIAAGLPALGAEIDGRANPLELGLRDLVRFDKGCYIGQEVVARLDSYEKVQRRLARLHLEGPASAGAAVRPADEAAAPTGRAAAGRLTTVAPNPAGSWWALALLPRSWAPGATLGVEALEAPIRRWDWV